MKTNIKKNIKTNIKKNIKKNIKTNIKKNIKKNIKANIMLVGCLLNVPATCECISGTDLHRQFYVLPH